MAVRNGLMHAHPVVDRYWVSGGTPGARAGARPAVREIFREKIKPVKVVAH